MSELAAAFEEHRTHLRLVAYRMLGTATEADDAVQETWIKLARSEPSRIASPGFAGARSTPEGSAESIDNLRGWLTTVVARQCLDMLRSRKSRREESLATAPEPTTSCIDRELRETIDLAALVVMDKLEPAERIAFVLHDLCAMSFDEIAPIVNRTSAAARQLASRARRRVRGATAPEIDVATQRTVVEAFIAALRAGDVEALVAVLGGNREWAEGAVAYRGATQHMRAVLVDGRVGLAFAPDGKLQRVLVFDFAGATIQTADIVVEPEAIAELVIEDLS